MVASPQVFSKRKKAIRESPYVAGRSPKRFYVLADDEKFNTMHQVLNSDLHEFTVMIDIEDPTTVKAGSNGGSNVSVICNRAYETVNLYSGVMTFPTSTITCTNRATQFAGTGPTENKT